MTTPQSSEPRIAYLVKQVERGLRARLDKVLAPLGVTTPEYTALSILGARDGLSSAQLARRVFVTPQAMNQIVLELEGRGLIRRKVSESHSRVMCISLTPKGATLLARCDRASLPIEERLLSSLSTADALVLRRVLTSCAHALADTAPAEDAGTAGANGRSRPRAAAGSRLRSE